MDTPIWLHNELAKGIAALLCLRLDYSPADDMVKGTIAAWGVAVSTGKVWDEALDRDRFAQAFRLLIASGLTRWPQPVKLLEVLPPREQLALPAARDPADPYERMHAERLAGYMGTMQ